MASKEKQIAKLYPKNSKGFKFVKKQGQIHSATFKRDGRVIIRDRFNKKVVVTKKDKRFDIENYTIKANYENRPLSSYADYFE